MSPTRTNRRLVEKLRENLDLNAVETALAVGDITARQARNLRALIEAVRDIRENPAYPVQDSAGDFIGEVAARNGGRRWVGCRYRPGFAATEFGTVEEAARFVRSAEPGDPETTRGYRPRIGFV